MSPPRPLMAWQLKQFMSAISCPALPAGPVVGCGACRRCAELARQRLGAFGLREQRRDQRIHLRLREGVLRHLHGVAEGARLPDLGLQIVRQRVRHAREQTRSSPATGCPPAVSSGAKLSGFLMPLISWQDAQPRSVTSALPCAILRRRGGLQVHIRQQIGIGLGFRGSR